MLRRMIRETRGSTRGQRVPFVVPLQLHHHVGVQSPGWAAPSRLDGGGQPARNGRLPGATQPARPSVRRSPCRHPPGRQQPAAGWLPAAWQPPASRPAVGIGARSKLVRPLPSKRMRRNEILSFTTRTGCDAPHQQLKARGVQSSAMGRGRLPLFPRPHSLPAPALPNAPEHVFHRSDASVDEERAKHKRGVLGRT